MKSFDEWNAYAMSRSEETDEEIINVWVSSQYLDMLAELDASGVELTAEVLRDVRKEVEQRAYESCDKILAEWAISRASERA